jgi:hypothetical protein
MKKFLKFLGYCALLVIQVFVSLVLLRAPRGELFQKAERWEWRYGCFFVAIFPVFMVIGPIICEKIPDSLANTFFNSGYAVFYFGLDLLFSFPLEFLF